jgi:hypothetical protein
MKLPLQLHQTPDLGAVHPQIRLHLGRRRRHGGKLNPQELGAPLQAPLQWGLQPAMYGVWSSAFQACMLG